MAKKIWFKFYSADYLLDSKIDALPLEAQAIVIRMWCVLHRDGRISPDPKEISRLCRVPLEIVQMHMQNIVQMFVKDADGLLYSKRMDEEMERTERISIVRTRAAIASHSKRLPANASANDNANGSAKVVHSESESDTTTPLPPKRGKRRSRKEIISEFSEGARVVVNELLDKWPTERPGNHSVIHPDVPLFASRVDSILRENPKVTPEILLAAARLYLSEKKDFPHAPEFFYGPGKNGDGPPWLHYARAAYHRQQQDKQAVTQ